MRKLVFPSVPKVHFPCSSSGHTVTAAYWRCLIQVTGGAFNANPSARWIAERLLPPARCHACGMPSCATYTSSFSFRDRNPCACEEQKPTNLALSASARSFISRAVDVSLGKWIIMNYIELCMSAQTYTGSTSDHQHLWWSRLLWLLLEITYKGRCVKDM